MAPLGLRIPRNWVKSTFKALGRCVSRPVTLLVARSASATAAADLACITQFASHPIVLDLEDWDMLVETPNTATLERQQAAPLPGNERVANLNEQQLETNTDLAATDAAEPTASMSVVSERDLFYDNFKLNLGAHVGGVDDADGERITDAKWQELLDDPEMARIFPKLLARNKAC